MKYTDRRGRVRRLTREQSVYLSTASARGGFDAGWGGLNSTLTVRLLEERGLITLWRNAVPRRYPRWRVTGLTQLGDEVLIRWRERAGGAG